MRADHSRWKGTQETKHDIDGHCSRVHRRATLLTELTHAGSVLMLCLSRPLPSGARHKDGSTMPWATLGPRAELLIDLERRDPCDKIGMLKRTAVSARGGGVFLGGIGGMLTKV